MSLSLQIYKSRAASVSSSAKALNADFSFTADELRYAGGAYVSVVGANIMVTLDGTTPTATLGIPLPENGTMEIENAAEAMRAQFIRQGSSDATVTISLMK